MKRKYVYTIIIIIITIGLFYAEKYVDEFNEEYPDANSTKTHIGSSEFDNSFLPTSTTGAIVHHVYYSLSYSETHEQAEWVA